MKLRIIPIVLLLGISGSAFSQETSSSTAAINTITTTTSLSWSGFIDLPSLPPLELSPLPTFSTLHLPSLPSWDLLLTDTEVPALSLSPSVSLTTTATAKAKAKKKKVPTTTTETTTETMDEIQAGPPCGTQEKLTDAQYYAWLETLTPGQTFPLTDFLCLTEAQFSYTWSPPGSSTIMQMAPADSEWSNLTVKAYGPPCGTQEKLTDAQYYAWLETLAPGQTFPLTDFLCLTDTQFSYTWSLPGSSTIMQMVPTDSGWSNLTVKASPTDAQYYAWLNTLALDQIIPSYQYIADLPLVPTFDQLSYTWTATISPQAVSIPAGAVVSTTLGLVPTSTFAFFPLKVTNLGPQQVTFATPISAQSSSSGIVSSGTPCGMIAEMTQQPKVQVLTLIEGLLGPAASILPGPLEHFFSNAYIYNLTMGQSVVEACSTAGAFMQSAHTGVSSPYKGFSPTQIYTAMQGTLHLGDVDTIFQLRMGGSTLNQNLYGMGVGNVSVLMGIPSFASIDSALGVLDDIGLESIAVCYCTQSYFDAEWQVTFNPGLNFVIKLDPKGPVGNFLGYLGLDNSNLILHGDINFVAGFVGSSFALKWVSTISLGALGHTTGDLALIIYLEQLVPGAPIPSLAIAIKAGFTVKFPGCSQPVQFNGEIRFNPATTQLTISMWMAGFLHFDKVPILKYFEVGNVIVCIGINLVEAAAGLVINEVFIGGTIGITGSQCGSSASSVTDGAQLAIYAGFDISASSPSLLFDVELVGGISLKEIVNFGLNIINAAGVPVCGISDVINIFIPPIEISKFKAYICTSTVNFGGQVYQEGFEILIAVKLFGVTALMDISFFPEQGRFTALGSLSEFQFGPLVVSGAGINMNWNPPGPVVRLEVDVARPPFVSLFISGLIGFNVLGFDILQAYTEVFLSAQGFTFELDVELLEIFSAQIIVNLLFVNITKNFGPISKVATKVTETIAKEATEVASNVIRAGSEAAGSVLGAGAITALGQGAADALNAQLQASLAKELVKQLDELLNVGEKFEVPIPIVGPKITTAKALKVQLENQQAAYSKLLKKYEHDIAAAGGNVDAVLQAHPDLAQAYAKLASIEQQVKNVTSELAIAQQQAKVAADAAQAAATKASIIKGQTMAQVFENAGLRVGTPAHAEFIATQASKNIDTIQNALATQHTKMTQLQSEINTINTKLQTANPASKVGLNAQLKIYEMQLSSAQSKVSALEKTLERWQKEQSSANEVLQGATAASTGRAAAVGN